MKLETQNSYVPDLSIQDLIDVKAHFGHKSKLRSYPMSEYILGTKNDIDIINVCKTHSMLISILDFLHKAAKANKKILFVATNQSYSDVVKDMAVKCGQYYIDKKWIGGTLTNYSTIRGLIKTLAAYNKRLEENLFVTKKERSKIQKERDSIHSALFGISEMNGRPDVVFVFDPKKDLIAIKETASLGIDLLGICDSISPTKDLTLFFPANNVGRNAISLYCKLIYEAIISGIRVQMKSSGVDLNTILANKKTN